MRKDIVSVLIAVAIAVALALPAAADDLSLQVIRATEAKTLDVGSGVKTISFEGLRGNVTVEGWDKPQVEVTIIKSTTGLYDPKQHPEAKLLLDAIKVAPETRQDAVVITTNIPEHDRNKVRVEYEVKAPRGMKVEVGRKSEGDVYITGMSADIAVTTRHGTITVDTPAEARYSIDAHTQYGDVFSDFEGQDRRHRLFHHDFTGGDAPSTATGAENKLLLRAEIGDIVILKTHAPHGETPLDAPKASGGQ